MRFAGAAVRFLFQDGDRAGLIAAVLMLPLLLLLFVVNFVLAQGPLGFAAWVDDDFFYYAVTAQHIADTGKSTFDGVELSNGYHPLWMVICVALARIFEIHTAGFFLAIFIVQSALVLAGTVLFARLLRVVSDSGLFASHLIVIGATIYGLCGVLSACSGMENALLWPLLPLFLMALRRLDQTIKFSTAFKALALLCLCFLARLDIVLVLAPICLAVLIRGFGRVGFTRMLRLAPAGLALLPALAYLAMNRIVFGDFLPVSGEAKHLFIKGAPIGLSALGIRRLFPAYSNYISLTPEVTSVLSGIGLVLAPFDRRIWRSAVGAGFLLFGLGLLLFYLDALGDSDWGTFDWYHGPLSLFGSVSLVYLLSRVPVSLPRRTAHVGAAIVASLIVALFLRISAHGLKYPPSIWNDDFTRALDLEAFVGSHPGRYGMGDGAGAVGYVFSGKVVQLEGLMNDEAMVHDINAEGSIEASLKRQHIDWYIYGPLRAYLGCTKLHEPSFPGPRAPTLSQTVCTQPVYSIWSRHHAFMTEVRDARGGLR